MSAKTMLDVLVVACRCQTWKVIRLGSTLSVISDRCNQGKEIRRVWSVVGILFDDEARGIPGIIIM